jgi:hypothetical protein
MGYMFMYHLLCRTGIGCKDTCPGSCIAVFSGAVVAAHHISTFREVLWFQGKPALLSKSMCLQHVHPPAVCVYFYGCGK